MSRIDFTVSLSPLKTVVSRKVIWCLKVLWYFGRELYFRMEIVSFFNKKFHVFSVTVPKRENVINVMLPFSWLGVTLMANWSLIENQPLLKTTFRRPPIIIPAREVNLWKTCLLEQKLTRGHLIMRRNHKNVVRAGPCRAVFDLLSRYKHIQRKEITCFRFETSSDMCCCCCSYL